MTKHLHIISREVAKANGLKKYFTGKLCWHGHFSERRTSSQACIECTWVPKDRRRASLIKKDDGSYISDKPCNRCGSLERGKFKQCLPCANDRRKEPSRRYWYEVLKGSERPREYAKKSRKNNKAASQEWSSRNRLRRRGQSLKNKELLKEIRKIYSNRPDGYHIDHLVPLSHPLVCGVHCPANLQYLSAKENLEKSNNWPTCQKSMQPACFDNVDNDVRV